MFSALVHRNAKQPVLYVSVAFKHLVGLIKAQQHRLGNIVGIRPAFEIAERQSENSVHIAFA